MAFHGLPFTKEFRLNCLPLRMGTQIQALSRAQRLGHPPRLPQSLNVAVILFAPSMYPRDTELAFVQNVCTNWPSAIGNGLETRCHSQ
jgi:hypothetical protein